MPNWKTRLLLLASLFVILITPQMFFVKAQRMNEKPHSSHDWDYWPTTDWMTTTPESQGMSSEHLDAMFDDIVENSYPIYNIVVVRNGYIVWEKYNSSVYDVNSKHLMYSVTKSFTSSLIGIALDKGYLHNLSQTMVSFFPDYTINNLTESKQQITVEHLLAMRAGMHWDETTYPYSSPLNGIFNINSGDGVNYSLNLPMIAEPGETWLYNTGASHLLAAIVARASGNTTLEFAEEHLFGPLGITDVRWYRDLAGWYKGGYDLKIRTRDMAKFGWLFLNNGTWDGEQIISQEWVNTSTATHTEFGPNHGYGYQWWTIPSFNIYYAAGLYGQYIFVIPDYDIVVAFNSAMSGRVYYPHIDYVLNYVLTSIDGYTPPGAEPDPLGPLVVASGAVIAVIVLVGVIVYTKKRS